MTSAMGWDTMFKMKHNLETSSVNRLVEDLSSKINKNVRGFINPADLDTFYELILELPDYGDNIKESDLLVEDDYLITKALVSKYQDKARGVIANMPNSQHLINEMLEVNNGLLSYSVHDDIMSFEKPSFWGITNDSLSGVPIFSSDRWSFMDYLFKNVNDSELWEAFISDRRKLYNYIKPILSSEYIYYYADQGIMEEISYIKYFDEIPRYADRVGLKILNLSDFILNTEDRDYTLLESLYIIKDDFKDLKYE